MFGDLFIVLFDSKQKIKHLSVSDYSCFYEFINEGFDDCESDIDDIIDETDTDDENFIVENSESDMKSEDYDEDDNYSSEEYDDEDLLDNDTNVY